MKTTLLFAALLVASNAQAQVQVTLNDVNTKVPFVAISSTDHVTEKTDVSSVTCRRNKNGTDEACSGTTAEVSDANNPGEWKYTFGAGDVDTKGTVTFRFSATGMDTTRALVQVGGVSVSQTEPRNTLVSASATGAVLHATENWADHALIGYAIYINTASTSNAGAWGCITENVQSTDAVTVSWANNIYPTGTTITYDLYPEQACRTLSTTGGSSGLGSETRN